jgi:hypothetical protein
VAALGGYDALFSVGVGVWVEGGEGGIGVDFGGVEGVREEGRAAGWRLMVIEGIWEFGYRRSELDSEE